MPHEKAPVTLASGPIKWALDRVNEIKLRTCELTHDPGI